MASRHARVFFQAGVEVDRADEGLEGVLKIRGAGAAAGAFLARPEVQGGVEAEAGGKGGESAAIGEDGAAAAKRALGLGGVERIERISEHELKHGVTEEFEALVARADLWVLVGIRGMSERLCQQRGVGKSVSEARLEIGEGVHVKRGGRGWLRTMRWSSV